MIIIKLIQDLIVTFLRDLELKIRMQNIKDSEDRILKLRNKLECEEYYYMALIKKILNGVKR